MRAFSPGACSTATPRTTTWHPRTRPAQLDAPEPGLRWLGLEVKALAQQDATHATVSFVARSKLGGRAHRLVETSRFERVDGADRGSLFAGAEPGL